METLNIANPYVNRDEGPKPWTLNPEEPAKPKDFCSLQELLLAQHKVRPRLSSVVAGSSVGYMMALGSEILGNYRIRVI